ncbi:MAG: hypothetical protein K8S22_14250, partial [Betaproteobacteria bacterium]|nr:hypothetical protein [Betaproteobacteria bacterium]
MRPVLLITVFFLTADFALAQSDALQSGQRKAGAAFSELQKAKYETKRVEQEFQQSDNDYKTAQKRADELKRQSEAAHKKLDVAKAKEA